MGRREFITLAIVATGMFPSCSGSSKTQTAKAPAATTTIPATTTTLDYPTRRGIVLIACNVVQQDRDGGLPLTGVIAENRNLVYREADGDTRFTTVEGDFDELRRADLSGDNAAVRRTLASLLDDCDQLPAG